MPATSPMSSSMPCSRASSSILRKRILLSASSTVIPDAGSIASMVRRRAGRENGVEGIGRVLDATFEPSVAALLEPWLSQRSQAGIRLSAILPRLARCSLQDMTRAQDRLTFCESRPTRRPPCARRSAVIRRVQVVEGDGWTVLQGHLPPPERRGLVLIDPPFEQEREFSTIIVRPRRGAAPLGRRALCRLVSRQGQAGGRRLHPQDLALPAAKILRVEIGLFEAERVDRLNGCGLLVVNPPWHFDDEAISLAAGLAPVLAREGSGTFEARLAEERSLNSTKLICSPCAVAPVGRHLQYSGG